MLLESTTLIQPHNDKLITMFREPTQGAPTPKVYGHQPKGAPTYRFYGCQPKGAPTHDLSTHSNYYNE